jgi:serine/threonine protein kinase
MHRLNLCHLDIKPANVLRFGDRWKMIDLEGAVRLSQPPATVAVEFRLDCCTPLYASPELARAVTRNPAILDGSTTIISGLAPSPKMDLWAAGVVLLDVLAHQCVFEEMWSGFQAQYLMEAEDDGSLGFQKEWYEWLADPTPIVAKDYVASPASSVSMLRESAELQGLLAELLMKEPIARLSSDGFVQHPFVSMACINNSSSGVCLVVPSDAPVGFAQRLCRRFCACGRSGRYGHGNAFAG